jgi:hypothetical protein
VIGITHQEGSTVTEPYAEQFPTRVVLMERIEGAWSALDDALIDLDAHQLTTIPMGADWSIADHVAHLAVWMRSSVAVLTGASRSEALGVSEAAWATRDPDVINEEIAAAWSGRSPADVLAALRTVQADLRGVISGLEDEDLARPYSHFQPETEPYRPDPVIGWITGDTFEHIEAHLPAINTAREQVI